MGASQGAQWAPSPPTLVLSSGFGMFYGSLAGTWQNTLGQSFKGEFISRLEFIAVVAICFKLGFSLRLFMPR